MSTRAKAVRFADDVSALLINLFLFVTLTLLLQSRAVRDRLPQQQRTKDKDNSHQAMASSNLTNLAKLLESSSVTDRASTGEEAFSNLREVELPLNAGVKGTEGFVLKKFVSQSRTSSVIVLA